MSEKEIERKKKRARERKRESLCDRVLRDKQIGEKLLMSCSEH